MTPEDLVEIELIKRVKYAYFRCLDLKQWDEIGELFTDDATASYGGGAYAFEGRDAIVDFFRKAMGRETFLSSHKAHHPEIDLTGPDTATGVWALEDFVIDLQWELDIHGAAFYEDEYVRVDGSVEDPAHRVQARVRGDLVARGSSRLVDAHRARGSDRAAGASRFPGRSSRGRHARAFSLRRTKAGIRPGRRSCGASPGTWTGPRPTRASAATCDSASTRTSGSRGGGSRSSAQAARWCWWWTTRFRVPMVMRRSHRRPARRESSCRSRSHSSASVW